MWQELINHQSFPYSEELNYYLDADSNFYQTSLTANKFSLAGECFLELAKKLDIDSENWLRKWQNNSYGEAECSVDYDWGDWLSSRTQQSVTVNFLSKYSIKDERVPNDYPNDRTTGKKEEIIPLIPREENLTSLIAIAHQEDIEQWSKMVFEVVVKVNHPVRFNDLIQTLNLSAAQIYLGIILSDLFILLPDEDNFYDGFLIESK